MKINSIISTIVLSVLLLSSCRPNKENVIKEFTSSMNLYDSIKISELLADSFIMQDQSGFINKKQFLNNLDSIRNWNYKSRIISLKNMDSLVVTEEEMYSMLDSVLNVMPKLIKSRKYYFSNSQISKVVIDTVYNFDEYFKSLNTELIPFVFFIEEQYNKIEVKDIFNNINKYVTEYSKLSKADKKINKTIAHLQGIYISKNTLYPKVEFKGKKSVIIYLLGYVPFATSYEIDENYVKIKSEANSEILLRIKDEKTLNGEGLAGGNYEKQF
jgi:hypothetical protein